MLLIDVVLIFVERVDDLIHIVSNVCGQSLVIEGIPSWGVASSIEASRLRREMCYLAYWILLKRSFPFILTSNKYIAKTFSYSCPHNHLQIFKILIVLMNVTIFVSIN